MYKIHADQPWYILGAGAIGCLLASQLAKQQYPVYLVVKTASTPTVSISYQPANLQDTDTKRCVEIPIVDKHSMPGNIHQLIVTTKAYDALTATQAVIDSLAPNAEILLLQNGLGSQQTIAKALPNQRITVGSVTHGCFLTEPFQVVHAGNGQVMIGELSPHSNNTTPLQNFEQLQQLSLGFHWTTSPLTTLWQKVAINSAINGLTVLYQCKNGGLWNYDTRRQQVIALCHETETVLKQLQIPLSDKLEKLVKQVILQTADNFSSTLQDVRVGKATELPFINGYIIEKAALLGINLPHHQRLIRTLKEKGYS